MSSPAPLRPASANPASTGGARSAHAQPAGARLPPPSPAVQAALRIVEHHRGTEGPLLPILHALQEELGCIPPETVQPLADALNLSRAEVHGVVSFYPHLRTEPPGRHVLALCRAEACQSRGAQALAEHARKVLGCDFHQTTPDGRVTLEPVYCLGLCAQSPSAMLDGKPHARLTADKLDRLLADASAAAHA
ncbi:formate dehydrogenase subunit gamma [Orrella sp. JC864]|uniref:formate dehydrogenase subunit gamma n=1 Tax=Orrella sp. JC864 TaxID=3120298 RepID=UPI0012BD58F2